MSAISLTVVSINGKPITPIAYGFETDDIVAPISNDGIYSTIVSRDVKGIDQQARSNAKYIYEVQEDLTTIVGLSDDFFLANVTYRKGFGPQYSVSYKRVFPTNIISGVFIPVSGGTQFYVGEDGDPNLVFYQVSETVAQIVAQSSPTGSFWALNGNNVGSIKKIGTIDNFDLPIITNNTEFARVTTSGNVGINTISPQNKLHIDTKLSRKTGIYRITNIDADIVFFVSDRNPNTNINGFPGDICFIQTTGNAGELYIKASGLGSDTGWLRIPDSNLVGTPCEIQLAASDETTALTTGTAKVTFRMPYAMTVTSVRASLSTAQTSGSIFTVDINESGSTILSTKLTIDNTEKTSVTAVTPPVISDSTLADDAEMTIDIDQVGDGTAKGLKITLKGVRA
jgi:hypothetical protein